MFLQYQIAAPHAIAAPPSSAPKPVSKPPANKSTRPGHAGLVAAQTAAGPGEPDTHRRQSMSMRSSLRDESRPVDALRVVKTLRPPQPGTIKLARHWGDALICVRYRHDSSSTRRYTTVELIVEEVPIQRYVTQRTVVGVTIVGPDSLRATAMKLGAQWDPKARLWKMSMRTATALGLAAHVREIYP